jgi:hypothetical protein
MPITRAPRPLSSKSLTILWSMERFRSATSVNEIAKVCGFPAIDVRHALKLAELHGFVLKSTKWENDNHFEWKLTDAWHNRDKPQEN